MKTLQPGRSPAWAGAPIVVLLLMLAGCATDRLPGGLFAGRQDSSASGAAAAEPRPSKPASGHEETASDQKSAVQVGDRKTVRPLATFEGDTFCTRLVAPFDLVENVSILGNMVTESVWDTAVSWGNQVMAQGRGPGAGQVVADARYRVPLAVRQAALRMNWLPMSAELAYGRIMLDKYRDAGELAARDSRVGRQLYAVGDQLLDWLLKAVNEPHDYRFELHVRTAAGENAVALPGGLIVVDAALLRDPKLRTKAEFALAHEISHIVQRHETRAAQARIIDTVALTGGVYELMRSMNLMRTDPRPLLQTVLAGKLQFERHAEVQELHADGCGVRLLNQAHRNVPRVVTTVKAFADRLPADTGQGGDGRAAQREAVMPKRDASIEELAADAQRLVEVVSRPVDRHPGTGERVRHLIIAIAKLRGGQAAPVPPAQQQQQQQKPVGSSTLKVPKASGGTR